MMVGVTLEMTVRVAEETIVTSLDRLNFGLLDFGNSP
jgi:hypothetical protein